MQEGQLDGVLDLLDLTSEATDVGVTDVRDLFEHQLTDIRLRDALVDEGVAAVHQQGVTCPNRHPVQRPGDTAYPLVFAPQQHQDPVIAQPLLHGDHVAGLLVRSDPDDGL